MDSASVRGAKKSNIQRLTIHLQKESVGDMYSSTESCIKMDSTALF